MVVVVFVLFVVCLLFRGSTVGRRGARRYVPSSLMIWWLFRVWEIYGSRRELLRATKFASSTNRVW